MRTPADNLAALVLSAVPDVRLDVDCLLRATARLEALCERDDHRRRGEREPIGWTEIATALADRSRFCVPRLMSVANAAPQSIAPAGKEILRADTTAIVNQRALSGPLWVKTTSGTTGAPVDILFDELHYLDFLLLTARRVAFRAGMTSTPRPAYFLIYVSDNPTKTHELWLDPWHGGVVKWVTAAETASACDELVALVRRLAPDAISLRPSLLEFLLRFSRHDGLFAGACGLAIVSGADLDDDLERRSALRLGIPIVEAYGLSEFGIVASACKRGDGMHFDSDMFVEVLRQDADEPIEDGRVGELVLTSLRNAAMPLVRYRTGDLASVERGVCDCGRATPRLTRIAGRAVRNFRLASGRLISPTRFDELFAGGQVREFQLTQTAQRRFHLRVDPSDTVRWSAVEFAALVADKIGEPADILVTFGPVTSPGAKFERYRVDIAEADSPG